MITNTKLVERFFRYVKIDTQSSEEAEEQPSTAKQRALADLLAKELEELGATVDYDRDHCYIYAAVPGDGPEEKALGFIAHMDTSPAVSGAGVKPRIIEGYDGKDEILTTEDFPELLDHLGEDLIATDGTTLLGADDKAGVSAGVLLHASGNQPPADQGCLHAGRGGGKGNREFRCVKIRRKRSLYRGRRKTGRP